MSSCDELADVYEWLIADAKLDPAGFAGSYDDVIGLLPPRAQVLDCSCGIGQLAVGLAERGMQVVASDASEEMVRRTAVLASQHGLPVRAFRAAWHELPDHLADGTFDMIFCVGNSLHHAGATEARTAALASMARLLRPGGRLVIASRTWELVRARGSRLEITDRMIRRNDAEALVVYRWDIAPEWEQEHHIEIAIARVGDNDSVTVVSELLSCWPYRHEDLLAELRQVGLSVDRTTFDLQEENYRVVASKP